MQFKASDKEQIVPFDRLTFDPRLQMRVFISEETIEQYAEDIRDGAKFPPLKACVDQAGKLWVYDGWHTAEAKRTLKHAAVPVLIEPGEYDDAFLKAAGANARGPRQRTREDMYKAAGAVLEHPVHKNKSAALIAEICGVSEKVVRTVKEQLAFKEAIDRQRKEGGGKPARKKPAEAKVLGRDGKTYPAKKKKKPASGKLRVNWAKYHAAVGTLTRFMDDLYRAYGKVDANGAVARDPQYLGVKRCLDGFVKGSKGRYKQITKEPAPEV